jgi:hypothetical protein
MLPKKLTSFIHKASFKYIVKFQLKKCSPDSIKRFTVIFFKLLQRSGKCDIDVKNGRLLILTQVPNFLFNSPSDKEKSTWLFSLIQGINEIKRSE